jgi:hypothetical protein
VWFHRFHSEHWTVSGLVSGLSGSEGENTRKGEKDCVEREHKKGRERLCRERTQERERRTV